MGVKNRVSIIIPCFNEERYIANTVNCVLSQDYPSELVEILIVDGLSTDSTLKILSDLARIHPRIRILENPDRTVPYAFNKAIPLSTGDIIIILGAHSELPLNYISILVHNLLELGASNVGTLMETLPPDNSARSLAISLACSSKIGMGNSHFRVGSKKIREVDTVPFGCYKREVFDQIGLFDTELTRNQDDEFNARLRKNGGKIFLIPDIKFTYFSRDSYDKLWRMFYQYGLFKPLVSKKIGRPTTLRQLAPPLFVLSVTALLFAGLYDVKLWLLLFVELILYNTILFISGWRIQKTPPLLTVTLHFILSIHTIHLSYGIGYILGVVRFILMRHSPSPARLKSSR